MARRSPPIERLEEAAHLGVAQAIGREARRRFAGEIGRRHVGGRAGPGDAGRPTTEQPHPRPRGPGACVGVLRDPERDQASGQGDLREAVGGQQAIEPPEGALGGSVGGAPGLLLLKELGAQWAVGALPGKRRLQQGAAPPRQGPHAARSRGRPASRVAWRPTHGAPRAPRWSRAGGRSLPGESPRYGGAPASPAVLCVVTQAARAAGRRCSSGTDGHQRHTARGGR
jgi:hypothetical protein